MGDKKVKRSEAVLVKYHTHVQAHIKAFFKSSMSTLPLSTSDVKQEVAIRKGDGDFYNLPAMTVMECFDAAVKKYGDKPALHQKVLAKVSESVRCMAGPYFTARAFLLDTIKTAT